MKFSKIKEQNGKISIKWRIFGCFAIFTVIILTLLWVFQIVFLNDFYKAIKINEIKSTAHEVAENIDSSNLSTHLQNIAQSSQTMVYITDSSGASIASNSQDVMPNNFINKMIEEQRKQLCAYIYKMTADNGGTYLEIGTPNSENHQAQQEQQNGPRLNERRMESMIFSCIVTAQNGQKRLIILNTNISPVDATVNTLRVQLIFITLIMLILGLFLALFLSKRISKPIININFSAKTLATGNYDIHFDEAGYKEIAELGQTLNYAAGELSKVETLRRDLIANISHYLRTPLTMITGYSEVMRDLPGENTPENVQIIIDEAKRLTTLVNDVLDISKLQSGTEKLNLTTFSLTQSIREMMTRYAKLTDYRIEFLADSDVNVHADELKISQVVYNLVNNAITYTGSDKRVTIRQIVNGNKVRIEVIDTGEGIPQDKLCDIWDRYYKVDKEHKRAQIGTGLGLSIVKTVLDMHGGTYGVQSEQGKGSTFWFGLDVFA